jgi:hypothetical protein
MCAAAIKPEKDQDALTADQSAARQQRITDVIATLRDAGFGARIVPASPRSNTVNPPIPTTRPTTPTWPPSAARAENV